MSESTIKPAKITKVLKDSIAAEIGFEIGDAIVSINGEKIRDLIDYQFLCADEYLTLEVQDKRGKIHQVEIEKDYDEDLGLEFETALFDGLMQCKIRQKNASRESAGIYHRAKYWRTGLVSLVILIYLCLPIAIPHYLLLVPIGLLASLVFIQAKFLKKYL